MGAVKGKLKLLLPFHSFNFLTHRLDRRIMKGKKTGGKKRGDKMVFSRLVDQRKYREKKIIHGVHLHLFFSYMPRKLAWRTADWSNDNYTPTLKFNSKKKKLMHKYRHVVFMHSAVSYFLLKANNANI